MPRSAPSPFESSRRHPHGRRWAVDRRMVATLAALLVTVATLATPVGAVGADEELDFDTLAAHQELTGDHAKVFRLYWAFFGRQPDAGGALYWITERDACVGLDVIADQFATSPEFVARYGQLDDVAFVERIYENVLRRPADVIGRTYWTGLLAIGELTRGGAVLHISLSDEFVDRHRYPSDGVPPRNCFLADGRPTGRAVDILDAPIPVVEVGGITVAAPAMVIERAGFHQSSHPGALPMVAVDPAPIRITTMASRNRGTDLRGAIDIAVEPSTTIVSPVSGTVARAGSYVLYCRYRDGYVVINPDGRPDLEVKILHVQGVAVRAGERVEVGDTIAANATTFPFRSQIDALTGEASWPHVHIEVVDPSIPRNGSGGSC